MIRRDPLFKGCTRPAMMWGIPITPFVVAFGFVMLLAIWVNLLLLVLFLPVYVLMRMVVKSDDQQFRLLGLKAKCRLANFNHNGGFWNASTYAPVRFKKRK